VRSRLFFSACEPIIHTKEYDVIMLLGSGKSKRVGSLSQPKTLLVDRKVNKNQANMYTSVYCRTTEIVASVC